MCTPFDARMKLYHNTGRAINQSEYARVIGCLMYAMTCTRLDIAYAVGKMSKYTSNLSHIHWNALHKILRYLRKTMDYGILYNGYSTVLEWYIDASWIMDNDDHKSTSEWIFTLGEGAIS